MKSITYDGTANGTSTELAGTSRLAVLCFPLLHLHNQTGHIVVLARKTHECIHRRHQALKRFAGGGVVQTLNYGQQALFTVLHRLAVFGFNNTVRKDEQEIAGCERRNTRMIRPRRADAQRQSAGFQPLDGARCAPQDGPIVARIDICEATANGLQFGQERGSKPLSLQLCSHA
jgi:hypothetical protein